MNIAIFGAAGVLGRELVEQGLAAGHTVRALLLDPALLEVSHGRLRIIDGDVADGRGVAVAVRGTDGVLSALGPTTNTIDERYLFADAARYILTAMAELGVRRYVGMSNAAVRTPMDELGPVESVAAGAFRYFARHAVQAKQLEYGVVASSYADWILARPARVVPGPRTGRVSAGNVRIGFRSRATVGDAAEFMLAQLTDDTWVRGAPFLASGG